MRSKWGRDRHDRGDRGDFLWFGDRRDRLAGVGWLDLLAGGFGYGIGRRDRLAWLVRRSRRGGYMGDGFGYCMGGDRGVWSIDLY